MALPTVQTLAESAEFSKTVQPYLPQLIELPARIVDTVSTRGSLATLYLETNPLVSAFAFSLFLGGIFFVASEINRNYSQVDRFWSLLPNVYILHIAVWAWLSGVPHTRVALVAVFSTIWSTRLTYNYWRKGGYDRGTEDYRWPIIRRNMPGWAFFLFNLTFIAFIQSILLMAFAAAPTYAILVSSQIDRDIGAPDIAFFVLELGLVLSEYVSDGQQWAFQTAKHRYQKDAKLPRGFRQADLDRGFITSGLWAYSRHPNFAAEQLIWLVLYQWGCYATSTLYNWTFAGAAFLVLLFQGSTWLTELISAGKYPEYADYRRKVGMFLPSSLSSYAAAAPSQPTVIRTSELAKKQGKKQQ